MRPIYRLLSVLTITLTMIASTVSACPNCKEAVADQSNAADLKSGYYYSILFMIGMPMTLLTVGVFTVVQASKKGLLPEM